MLAAQHVRAALQHLRNGDRRWRAIIKAVGPFTYRPHRNPLRWLAVNLAPPSDTPTAQPSCPLSSQAESGSAARPLWTATWRPPAGGDQPAGEPELTPAQARLAAQLSELVQSGRLSLLPPAGHRSAAPEPAPPESISNEPETDPWPPGWGELPGITAALYDRFCFYCLGQLDCWPRDCPQLAAAIQRAWQLERSPDPDLLRQITLPWSPYRSIAAWYLDQWSLQ